MIKQILNDWILPAAKDAKNFLADVFFPMHCLACDKEGSFLCIACQKDLTPVDYQQCIICQKPSPMGITHSGCESPHKPDGLVSFYDYHDPRVAKSLIYGKYYFLPSVYELFGNLMSEQIANTDYKNIFLSGTWIITPIPLAKSRLRWRGFNQAEILSQTLSKHLSLTSASVLVRCKSTKTQKDLKKEERVKNMSDAFALAPTVDIHGKNIILVDDVTTTGSTLLEGVKVLQRNGASKVWCLTVARD